MHVMFVVPPFPNRVSEYLLLPSIEICIWERILASQGHSASLLDCKIDNIPIVNVHAFFKLHQPDIICIVDDSKTHCNSVRMINELRTFYGEHVKIAICGEIVSFVPDAILARNRELDYVIRFDDDYALLNIVECLEGKRSLDVIPNIAYRDELGNIRLASVSTNHYDINHLPLPNREFYDLKKYLRRDTETIVRSTRGCHGKCLFCIKTRMQTFRTFSIERFCDEIEQLQSFGFTSFFFSDDTFAFSDERLDAFYDEVKQRDLKIRWTSNIRVADINEHKLERMKEIGAYRVFVGIETINSRTSKTIGKGLNRKLIEEKIALLKNFGLEFHASFILGNPGDTEDDLRATLNFAKEIQPTISTFNLIKIFPGLDLYENPNKYGIVMEDKFWFENDDWTHQVVMGTRLLPPEVLEIWSRKCLFEMMRD